MGDYTDTSSGNRRSLRDWMNPLRLYDPRRPAGRVVFLWGLAGFPFAVIFVLLTGIIIFVMSVWPNINPDFIGIIVYPFMLAWIAAAVAITRRRLLELGRSPNWVWLVVLPFVYVPFCVYLLLKPGPAGIRRVNVQE